MSQKLEFISATKVNGKGQSPQSLRSSDRWMVSCPKRENRKTKITFYTSHLAHAGSEGLSLVGGKHILDGIHGHVDEAAHLCLKSFHQDRHQQVKQDIVAKSHEGHKVKSSEWRRGSHTVVQNPVPVLLGQNLWTFVMSRDNISISAPDQRPMGER